MSKPDLLLPLTERQARCLRLLLLGEISHPMIEQAHRRTWREIVVRMEREPLFAEEIADARRLEGVTR